MTQPNPPQRELWTRAPSTVVVICLTVVAVAVLFTVGALAYVGRDPKDVLALVSVALNFAGVLLGGSALVVSGTAARAATKTEDALNGALEPRIEAAVQRVLEKRDR